MQKFYVEDLGVEEFTQKVSHSLEKTWLKDVARLQQKNEEVQIIFERVGKSTISYEVFRAEMGFTAERKSEHIAWAHKFFQSDAENLLLRIMEKLGAKKVE